MSYQMTARLLALAVAVLTAVVLTAPAGADAAAFGCRASALQAVYVASRFEPTVANAGSSPCTDAVTTSTRGGTATAVQFSVGGAFTHTQRRRDEAPGAGALASLTGISIKSSTDQVTIEAAQADASLACASGTLAPAGSSQVTGLTIDGKQIPVPNSAQTTRLLVGTGGSYLLLAQSTTSATSVTRTAAMLHLVGVGDFTIAQTVVTAGSSDPCGRSTGFLPAVQPCPDGSVYQPTAQNCAITAFTRRPIVISSPFRGPIGVAVFSLGHARAKIRNHRCLEGPGPGYVLVGTPTAGGLIVGTKGADRILAFGDYQIDGQGGKDCMSVFGGIDTIRDGSADVRIFGGPGRERITLGNGDDSLVLGVGFNEVRAGNGNDQIQIGPGTNRITVGNGNDTITGGLGFDRINAGNGNDKVVAGPGIDEISVGTGRDTIDGSLGFDRTFARGPGALVRCGLGRDQVVVNPAAATYARRHGCTDVVGTG